MNWQDHRQHDIQWLIYSLNNIWKWHILCMLPTHAMYPKLYQIRLPHNIQIYTWKCADWKSQCLLWFNSMKCKKNALLYSQLSNNTLLLLSTHPPYFSPHTSEAILSTHCHTSTGSVRYLLCPAAFLESSCCSFTLTFHWHTAFWLFVSYSHLISHLATKWEIGHTKKLAFMQNPSRAFIWAQNST